MRFTALVAFTALLTWAQDTPGSIRGVVMDAASKAPVRRANVMLQFIQTFGNVPAPAGPVAMGSGRPGGVQPAAVITDANGSFVFAGLAAGRYAVMAMHPRYPISTDGSGSGMEMVEVKAGAETSGVTLTLVPGAAVSGRVTDADGDPILGCAVQTLLPDGNQFGTQSMGMTPSDENGAYRIWGLAAGKYYVLAHCPRPALQPRPLSPPGPVIPTVGYPRQIYPLAADLKAGELIELGPGMEKSGVDFRIKASPVTTVTGMVTQPDGTILPRVQIALAPRDRVLSNLAGRQGAQVDQGTGTFQIVGVFPGSYYLLASSTGGADKPMAARQAVEVGERPLQVNVRLQPAVELTGVIDVEGDKPEAANGIMLQLFPADMYSALPTRPEVSLGENGRFVVKNVLPGTWRVQVMHSLAFLKSVDAGGREVPDAVLDTTNGDPGPLRVVLSTKTGTVSGSAPAGQSVHLLETSDGGRGMQFSRSYSGTAAPGGEFVISGVPPGRYRVVVGRPRALPFLGEDVPEVVVAEGGSTRVDVNGTAGR